MKCFFSCDGDVSILQQLLDSSLTHVNTLGWTNESLVQGALDCKFSLPSHSILPRGPIELVEHFLSQRTKFVINSYNHETSAEGPSSQEAPGSSSSDRARILLQDDDIKISPVLFMIYRNIDFVAPYISVIPQAAALLVEPNNIISSLNVVFQTSNDICQAAGIKAARLDWYFERGAVVVLLCSTGTYYLTSFSDLNSIFLYTFHFVISNDGLLSRIVHADGHISRI